MGTADVRATALDEPERREVERIDKLVDEALWSVGGD
jgi:hypothetical protein